MSDDCTVGDGWP